MDLLKEASPEKTLAYAKACNNQQLLYFIMRTRNLANDQVERQALTAHAAKKNKMFGDNAILESINRFLPIFEAEARRRKILD